MHVNINGLSFHVEYCGKRISHWFYYMDLQEIHPPGIFYDDWGKHSRLIVLDIIGHGKTDAPEEITVIKWTVAADINRS